MLTREEDIDAHALHKQGWTITAIARHLGRDRKTIRAYLTGQRVAGVRARQGPDPFAPFSEYVRARLAEDPHLWVTTLADELEELGWSGGYSTLTRQIRDRGLRPVCEACRGLKDRPVAIIDHPPGAETQWDWVELPDPPAHWGWGKTAHLLVGASSHSSRWRGVLAESVEQAHLIVALHQVAERLGGLTRAWRFDRMATVATPGTGKVTATFAAVAKHYAVTVEVCPPRRGNRKGVVEKANHTAAQRIWRSMPETIDGCPITVEQAQARIDTWRAVKGDTRRRVVLDPDGTHRATTVGELAEAEPLRPLPAPFPVTTQVVRTVTAQGLVAYAGNFYSAPPELARARVTVSVTHGTDELHIAAAATPAVVLARHRLIAPGTGATIRTEHHVVALNTAAMTATDTGPRHRHKRRVPPGPAATTAADALCTPTTRPGSAADVVIDLDTYARAAHRRNTLT
ncbi:Mu transposase domain-containing protein [Cellulomonas bogoriensis]|uniref:Transcriptional regulator n=1 Tax=Cellulomonas bogoriensis 69B4 = DSM 16987 TaxID=1386082 RepID=A0A0A0BX96_9CELL|nr:DDE-type integrase/transposase/recombinase [Cellulomonas bogoriensis]KGM12595.1 transcriptional regulator [Cellulomonas bogoriensis 69B4 = DSM 16987]